MSGGGGGGTTISTAELPPELRPLFSGAGQQLLATQNALPLNQFTQWNPGSVAGIAPMQQAALDLLPSTTQAPSGLQALYGSAPGLNAAATGLYDVAGRTGPSQAALNTLSNSGRIAPMQLTGSPLSTEQFANLLPEAPNAQLFPGAPAVSPSMATGLPSLMTPGAPQGLQLPNATRLAQQSFADQMAPQLRDIQELLQNIQTQTAPPPQPGYLDYWASGQY